MAALLLPALLLTIGGCSTAPDDPSITVSATGEARPVAIAEAPPVCDEPAQTPPLRPGENVLRHHSDLRAESIELRERLKGCREERAALPELYRGTAAGVP